MQMKDTQPGTLIQLPVGKVSIQKKFISKRNRYSCAVLEVKSMLNMQY